MCEFIHPLTVLSYKYSMEISGYKIERLLGVGATSEVFLAKRDRDDQYVALKRFSPIVANDPEARERLEQEVKTLSQLNDPNIVSLLDVFDDKNTWGLELEYVDGVDIKKWNDSVEYNLIEPKLWVIANIAKALGSAHTQGIIHRDLKPENVLVSREGEIKLTDFGLAKSLTSTTLTRTGVLVGSLAYMPPEVLNLSDSSHLSDIYSLGVIAYLLLTGDLPHKAESPQGLIKQICQDDIISPRSENSLISKKVSDLVASCLEISPEKRPQSVWHIHAELMLELMQSELLHLCPSLVKTPFNPTSLNESLVIKKNNLLEIASSDKMEIKLEAIGHLQILFPDLEELPGLMASLSVKPDKNQSKKRSLLLLLLLIFFTGITVSYRIYDYKKSKKLEISRVAEAKKLKELALIDLAKKDAISTKVTATTMTPPKKKREKKQRINTVTSSQRKYGFISFEIPDDVKAFVDGIEVPKKSLNKFRVSPGDKELRLVKNGYPPIMGKVTVQLNETSIIRAGTQ